jgi:hypothetical protein
MIRLLVDDGPLRAGMHERKIILHLHRRDLQTYARNNRRQLSNTPLQIVSGDKFRVLARDEQEVAEPLVEEMPGFAQHFANFERDAQDGVLARKAAVDARVDALVGQIERREEAHRSPKVAPGQRGGFTGHRFELCVCARREQSLELSQERGFLAKRFADFGRKEHATINHRETIRTQRKRVGCHRE